MPRKSGTKSNSTEAPSPQPEPAPHVGINKAKAERVFKEKFGDDKRRTRKRRRYLVKWAKPEQHDAWWFCTPKERQFITSYLKGASARDAAATANLRDSAAGFRMLQKPHVRAALHQKTIEAMTATGIDVVQWWRETWNIASLPLEMCAGKPTVADKLKALQLTGLAGSIIRNNVHHSGDIGFLHMFERATAELMKESLPPAQIEQTQGETLEHQPAEETLEAGS